MNPAARNAALDSTSEAAPEAALRVAHTELLRRSHLARTGRHLVAPGLAPEAAAEALWLAPFALLSHSPAADPLLTYANRTALALFELDWEAMLRTPSRLTAERPEREERERLLAEVARAGCIHDYSGVRISQSGRRFRIRAATVWNLADPGAPPLGQAACFSEWHPL
jgi:hypothetical protein